MMEPWHEQQPHTDAFNAVAEPRRRQILDLSRRVSGPVNDLVECSVWPSRRCPSTCACCARWSRCTSATTAAAAVPAQRPALKPIHDWVAKLRAVVVERFELMDDVLDELKETEQRRWQHDD
jgi:hypothetical protein